MASIQNMPSGSLPAFSEKILKSKIAIVYAEWNSHIIEKLLSGCKKQLLDAGIKQDNILEGTVPGSFELSLGAQYMLEYGNADAVICIGVLIKGETPHFHYISEAVTLTLSQLGVRHSKPVIFGVLTVDTEEQALERAGGVHGNKGEEAAAAALKMLHLKEQISEEAKSKKNIGFMGGR